MEQAPIPANDDARLAELRSYGLLDTPPDPDFDDISHLICSIAGTPIGIVSLVDENRQWFKSCIGLAVRETPRAISFCGHAILQRRPLIVEDALADERFRDNPLVQGDPHIRFYAGVPLVSANGLALGTLCAVDSRPRRLDDARIDALQRLARQTVRLMELRRERRLLEASQQLRRQEEQRGQEPQQEAGAAQGAPGPRLRQAEEVIRSLELMVGQESQPCFAVLRIGLKDLRRLQSGLGSTAVEAMRQALSERLLRRLPREAAAAWLRDSELVVVLPYASSEQAVAELAGTISRELGEPLSVEGRLLSSRVAIGIALYMGNYASAEALLADAAIAQQVARFQPGSPVRVIDLATRLEAQQNISLEAGLRRVLRDVELEPWFQPIVELDSGAVVGLEALLRCRDHNGELVQPGAVLAAAARAGLTEQVDLQLIQKALEASGTIAAARPQQPLLLSLNLSTALLDNPTARQQLLELIGRLPPPPGWTLQLEVIEEALRQSPDELESFLETLGSRGVLVAIDDFGTGYSSLSRLHSYPFHALKIDASFVARIDDPHQPSNRLLELIQRLSRDLGLHTTAEGIETEAQRRWLVQQGFEWGQGFLFDRPMPLDALLSALVASAAEGKPEKTVNL
jgi:EAL domain-containing protein (putative c-di-GMP-specific phosphodiesterase class I)/GAF domain-containing protein